MLHHTGTAADGSLFVFTSLDRGPHAFWWRWTFIPVAPLWIIMQMGGMRAAGRDEKMMWRKKVLRCSFCKHTSIQVSSWTETTGAIDSVGSPPPPAANDTFRNQGEDKQIKGDSRKERDSTALVEKCTVGISLLCHQVHVKTRSNSQDLLLL